jgi:hypothetical protein
MRKMLVASAFIVAAAVGACRGEESDDYDMNPPPAGSVTTAPGDTMMRDTAGTVPVPGTPHRERPGVTDDRDTTTPR